jgi:CheY-like chemotaxis protein
VSGVSLRIRPGEIVALLGPNGAGKTTTIDMLLGLSNPTSGEVRVYGRPPQEAVGLGLVSAVMQTGVLLADDQALVRGAMAALLDMEPDLMVVAEVGRGDEVVAAARYHAADVALLDVEMPGMDGVAAARELHRQVPGCRVLMVTTFGRAGYLRQAMAAGASGFIVKDTPARQLADAVRLVHQALRVVDPALAAQSLARANHR